MSQSSQIEEKQIDTKKFIGNFFLCNDKIIKVSQEYNNYVIGYNILTENICKAPKALLLPIPGAIFKLIGCERAQVMLVQSKHRKLVDMAKMMKVSERTMYRKIDRNGLRYEE